MALELPEDSGAGGLLRDERAASSERDERFRLLINSVIDYAIFTLDPSGVINSWNPGAKRLKGYEEDEIVGRHFSCFYPPEDIEAGKPASELAIATAEGRVEDEGWRVRKDGSLFWANTVITALRDEAGRLRGFGKVTRDLSERKKVEDALREVLERERSTTERLREVDRMKTEFVGIVAHDLKSPMSVIGGFAGLLIDNWEQFSDDRRRELLHRIGKSTRRLNQLVNDILEVSRIESGELSLDLKPVELRALIERAVSDALASETPERIKFQLPDRLPLAQADEHRTWQILTNLLSNALKFSGDELVDVEVRHEEPVIQISVTDRGPGIAPSDQLRLFERFSRLPQPPDVNVRGSGLGLYIAKSMVELQGGSIWVESDLGKGTTFTFTLPVAVPT